MPAVRSTAGFQKAVKKLKDRRRQRAALDAVERFIESPSHPSLNFERITGTSDCWSIRATSGNRIILRRRLMEGTEKGAPVEIFDILDVGKHDIYRRY